MLLLLICILLCFVQLNANILSYDQECNPKGNSLFPFSGFKIYREYKFHFFDPIPVRYLVFVHCDHGKVDYRTYMPQNGTDINWELPICVLRPRLGKLLPMHKHALKKGNKPEYSSSYIDSILKIFRYKLEVALEKASLGKYFQYTGKVSAAHLEDIKNSTSAKVLEWELKDLVCFKMARKKTYAKRAFSFYMPDTFVGGLFECPVSKEQREEIFRDGKLKDNILQPLQIKCNPETARAIMPLLAEDSTKQGFSAKLNLKNSHIVQTIPYLTTAPVSDIRFTTTGTADMTGNSWASQLLVNENYDFSDIDLHFISKAITATTDFLNRILVFDLSVFPMWRFGGKIRRLLDSITIEDITLALQKLNQNLLSELWIIQSKGRRVEAVLREVEKIWANL